MNEGAGMTVRRIATIGLTGVLGLLFLASAAGKFAAPAPLVEGMTKWGLGEHRLLIAVGELTSAVLFLIPQTAGLGVLLLSSYMGGAIVTHMQHGESYVVQSVILALIYLVAFLRFPQLLPRLGASKPASGGPPDA
jgi:hypothetical protein